MSSSSIIAPPSQDDRKWFSLGIRHLRMASRLLRGGFVDGAVFHAYHGYECILSALIAAKGYPVPPEGSKTIKLPGRKSARVYPSPLGDIKDNAHKARIVLFDALADQSKPYFVHHQLLKSFLPYQVRNDSLYFDPTTDQLPQQRFLSPFATGLIPNLQVFAQEVRMEIS